MTLSLLLATACGNIGEYALKKSCFFLTNFSCLSCFLCFYCWKDNMQCFLFFLRFFLSQTVKWMFERKMLERCSTFLRQEMQTTTKIYFFFKNARGANAYRRHICLQFLGRRCSHTEILFVSICILKGTKQPKKRTDLNSFFYFLSVFFFLIELSGKHNLENFCVR